MYKKKTFAGNKIPCDRRVTHFQLCDNIDDLHYFLKEKKTKHGRLVESVMPIVAPEDTSRGVIK